MYQPLVPCPSCARHVRATEASCPFCAVALPSSLKPRVVPVSPVRLSRAAAFLFGASLALTACGSDVQTPSGGSASTGSGGDGPDDDGGVHAEYGGPPADAGPDDDGGDVALYGVPPPLDGGPDDDGGNQAEYGGPPPPDEDGGAQPLYGSPPPPP